MDGGLGRNPVAPDETTRRLIEKLRRELGPRICGYLHDPAIIEIMLNPDGALWIDRLGSDMERVGFMDAVQAEALMGTVAAALRTKPLRASGLSSNANCRLTDRASRR
jgi:Flp pilus assembly CpaF family ATPase